MSGLLLAVVLAAAPRPISFDDAVKDALARHPALRVAEQDAARALAQLEQARAPSLPSLGVNGNLTVLDEERRRGELLVAPQVQTTANAQLAVPLLNTPRWAQWYRSSQALDAARATAADVKRQVAVAAARAWLSVLAQRRVVVAATTARDTARAHLSFARERFAGGVGTRLDELRAAQELSVSSTQLETALGNLARAQEVLGVAAGLDEPLDALAQEPALSAPDGVEQALGAVEGARLDVKAAKARREAATAAARVDWLDYLPLLSAVFQPFVQAQQTLAQPNPVGWQLNGVLQLPLYEGGLRSGQAKERRAAAVTADAQWEGSLRQARSEVRAAFRLVTHADAALSAARESAGLAAEALELANLAYRAGATTNLEVIDAERRARDAEVQAVLAEDTARQARLDLLVASGRFPSP